MSQEHDNWREKFNDLHAFLSSKSEAMMRSVEPGDREALKIFMEQLPDFVKGIGHLEDKLVQQQGRLELQQKGYNDWKKYKDNQVASATTSRDKVGRQKEKLRNRVKELETETEQQKERCTKLEEELHDLRNRVEEVETETGQQKERCTKLEEELHDLRVIAEETELEVESLTAQLHHHRQSDYEGSPELQRKVRPGPVAINTGVARKTTTSTPPPPFPIQLQSIPDILPQEVSDSL